MAGFVSMTQLDDHGPATRRWNVLVMGDGYTSSQLPAFATHALRFRNALRTAVKGAQRSPSLWNAVNVYRLDVESDQSGANDPTECGGTGARVSTFLGASFCNSGIRRLLTVDASMARPLAHAHLVEGHQIVVIVNSSLPGGSGDGSGSISVVSSASDVQTAIHELGHSAFGLADEYPYWAGCGIDTDRDSYPGRAEPASPNVSRQGTRPEHKWETLCTTSTMPTMSNSDRTRCDPRVNTASPGTVGTFEGAHHYHGGVYRPQFRCKMNTVSSGFCKVCKRAIKDVLTPFLP